MSQVEAIHLFQFGDEQYCRDCLSKKPGHAFFCDFCTGENPMWVYKCRPFLAMMGAFDETGTIIGTAPFVSFDDWAACVVCKGNIETGDVAMLVARLLHMMEVPKEDRHPEAVRVFEEYFTFLLNVIERPGRSIA